MSSSLIHAVRPHPTADIDVPARLDAEQQQNLLHALAAVPDPRRRRGVRYRLASLLAVAVCAVLAGATTFAAIADWACTARKLGLRGLTCGCVRCRSLCGRQADRHDRVVRISDPASGAAVDRALPPNQTACGRTYSNWIKTKIDIFDPEAIQLYDVGVDGCIRRDGATVYLNYFWDTNGYAVLDASFKYDLWDCTTGRLIWHHSIPYERGTPNTSGAHASSHSIDPTHFYRVRAHGGGHINTFPYSTFGMYPPPRIAPTVAWSDCV
jgi:hypothetical protein